METASVSLVFMRFISTESSSTLLTVPSAFFSRRTSAWAHPHLFQFFHHCLVDGHYGYHAALILRHGGDHGTQRDVRRQTGKYRAKGQASFQRYFVFGRFGPRHAALRHHRLSFAVYAAKGGSEQGKTQLYSYTKPRLPAAGALKTGFLLKMLNGNCTRNIQKRSINRLIHRKGHSDIVIDNGLCLCGNHAVIDSFAQQFHGVIAHTAGRDTVPQGGASRRAAHGPTR